MYYLYTSGIGFCFIPDLVSNCEGYQTHNKLKFGKTYKCIDFL